MVRVLFIKYPLPKMIFLSLSEIFRYDRTYTLKTRFQGVVGCGFILQICLDLTNLGNKDTP